MNSSHSPAAAAAVAVCGFAIKHQRRIMLATSPSAEPCPSIPNPTLSDQRSRSVSLSPCVCVCVCASARVHGAATDARDNRTDAAMLAGGRARRPQSARHESIVMKFQSGARRSVGQRAHVQPRPFSPASLSPTPSHPPSRTLACRPANAANAPFHRRRTYSAMQVGRPMRDKNVSCIGDTRSVVLQ